MSANILRDLVGRVFQIDPRQVRLAGELPEGFRAVARNCSGSLFQVREERTMWGFHPTQGFKKVEPEWFDNECQDADGTWRAAHGYSFEYLADQAQGALFLLSLFKEDSWQSGGHDSTGEVWTLYKCPDFAQYWANIEQEDLLRWQEWLP